MQRVPTILSVKKEKSVGATCIPRVLVALLFCVAMLGRPAVAQTGQEFVGHVEDSAHAAIAKATVIVHNEDTGENITAKTTAAGDYTIPYVKIGTYTVSVSMPGFKDVSKTHITLNTDQSSKIDFTLPVGDVTETVTVNSEGSQIELSKADRGEIVNAEQVQEMPTDGRNILELFTLAPGTVSTHSHTATRPQDNVGDGLKTNGNSQVVQENLDGANNDNPAAFAVAYVPPLDSVAEFKVVTNPYDASYGRAGGGAIDVTLKSGTNKIHGDIYEYWRRPWLDANTFGNDYTFATAPPGTPLVKPQHKRDQFGFEADGPVYIPHIYNGHDKTFFTMQYEESLENLPDTKPTTSSIPSPNWLKVVNGGVNFGPIGAAGCFPIGTPTCDPGLEYFNTSNVAGVGGTIQPLTLYDPLQYATIGGVLSKTEHLAFPNNTIPLHCTPTPPNTQCSSINPIGLAIAQYYTQGITPNQNLGPTYLPGTAPFQSNFVNEGVEYDISRAALVKLDHNFGPRDRGTLRWGAFERYATQNSRGIPLSNPINNATRTLQPKDETFAIEEIHTFSPTFILDNKVNVSNLKQGQLSGVAGNFLGALGFSQHYQNATAGIAPFFPNITGTGFVDMGVGNPGNYTINHVLSYQPSITLIRGRHTFRAGYDMRLYQWATPGTGTNPSFSFNNQYTQELYNNNSTNSNSGLPGGYQSGSGLASLLIGDANSGSLSYRISAFTSQHYYAGWAQDDWKITSKMTLNIGIRYDILQAPVERHNKADYAFDTTDLNTPINTQVVALHNGLFCPSPAPQATNLGYCLNGPVTGGILFAGTTTDQNVPPTTRTNPRGAYLANLLHFQPRFGLAYAFTNRTSLRLGFGQMYINNRGVDHNNGFSADSSYLTSSNVGTPNGNFEPLGNLADPYPATPSNPIGTVQPLGASLGLATTPGASINFTNTNYQVPSIWESSASLEQILSRRDTLDISYSGSRLYNGEASININPQSAAYNAQCDFDRTGDPNSHNICDSTITGPNQGQTANPFQNVTFFSGKYLSNPTIARGDLSRPFPAFTDVTQEQSNVIHSWYNSLQVSYHHTVSKSLTIKAYYTWSKAMTAGNQLDASNGVYGRSLDGSDRPNLFSFSSVFYVPVGRGKALLGHTNRLVDAAVGGWEISPLYLYAEGTPWSLGNNWIVNSPIRIKTHDVAPTPTQVYTRLQGVTPCVAYENDQAAVKNGPTLTTLVYGPTYFEFGCTAPALIRASSHSVAHNVVYSGVRQGAYHGFDVSVSKRFAWNERANLQLRLDAFNVLNHPNWTGGFSNDPTKTYFGALRKGPDGVDGSPRDLQLSGKITF